MPEGWGWPVLLGVLGAVFGSFIATIAVRWPAGRSVAKGRSECDSCGRTLGAGELVPLLSYAVLRGRCAGCRAWIPPGHPLTELIGLGIGVAAGWIAPGVPGIAGAVFGWLLLALGALDWAAFWLPDILTGALALTGLASGLVLDPPLFDRGIGGIAGYATLRAVGAAYRGTRGREGLGGGDAKLFGAIGLWLGWRALPVVLLLACAIGLAVALALRLGGRQIRMDSRLPLGVMLAIAGWAVWLATAAGWRGI
jgi:leader peptidase (prepilin peptidase)/N-methyltransferase